MNCTSSWKMPINNDYTCQTRSIASKVLCLICWQICNLGFFTPFIFMRIEPAREHLAPAHKSNQAPRLEEQEDDNEQAVNKRVQIGAADASRSACHGQPVQLINDQRQSEDERCSKN